MPHWAHCSAWQEAQHLLSTRWRQCKRAAALGIWTEMYSERGLRLILQPAFDFMDHNSFPASICPSFTTWRCHWDSLQLNAPNAQQMRVSKSTTTEALEYSAKVRPLGCSELHQLCTSVAQQSRPLSAPCQPPAWLSGRHEPLALPPIAGPIVRHEKEDTRGQTDVLHQIT